MSPRRQVLLTLGVLAFLAIGAITAATTPNNMRAAVLWLAFSLVCGMVLLLIIVWAARPLSADEMAEQELDEQLASHRAHPRTRDEEGASA